MNCKYLAQSTLFSSWRLDPSVRPDGVSSLVCAGVPDSLRPQVWLLLTGASEAECADLAANYALLVENVCQIFQNLNIRMFLNSRNALKNNAFNATFTAHFPPMNISNKRTVPGNARCTV
jgi:hypothetical protein